MSNANMSFGRAPQEPAKSQEEEEPTYRFVEGKLVDSKTGEPVVLLDEQAKAAERELDKIADHDRFTRAVASANMVLIEQFPHLSDVPRNARASISREELMVAMTAAAKDALKRAGR